MNGKNRLTTPKTTVRELEEILYTKTKQQLIKGSKLQLNNTVKILKPARGQHNEGIIIGVIKDNLAKIRTGNGSVIRRISRNIEQKIYK